MFESERARIDSDAKYRHEIKSSVFCGLRFKSRDSKMQWSFFSQVAFYRSFLKEETNVEMLFLVEWAFGCIPSVYNGTIIISEKLARI